MQVGVNFEKDSADRALVNIMTYVSEESAKDLQFNQDLNPAVHSAEFFVEVNVIIESPLILQCCGTWSPGVLMPSQKTIDELKALKVSSQVCKCAFIRL